MPEIIDRGVVCAGEALPGLGSIAFPGLAVSADGTWLVTARAAPTKTTMKGNCILSTRSENEGRTWSDPERTFAMHTWDGRHGIFRTAYPTALPDGRFITTLTWVDHSDPERPFYDAATEGVLEVRPFFAVSEDGGRTWDEPRLIDTRCFNFATPFTGPILITDDGAWMASIELSVLQTCPAPKRQAAVLFFSKDEGRTWPEHTIVAESPDASVFWWDQRPGRLGGGSMLNLFWTFLPGSGDYLNIHVAHSGDNGRTWMEPRDTGVPGQPAPPVLLDDGRVVMVFVDRTGAPMIKARVSDDAGFTWPESTECVIHDLAARSQTESKAGVTDAWNEMLEFSVGLPTTALLPNGDVLVAYYAGPDPDHTGIEWARLAMD